MLYRMHEIHHSAVAPMRMFAETMHTVFSNPWMPMAYTRFGRSLAASCVLIERTTRKYPKPPFALATACVDGQDVAVCEVERLRTPFCSLLHFQRDTARTDPKVLVVAPLSGHYATLLRGTVDGLMQDHDVYVTDWIDAREVPLAEGVFDLDAYVDTVIDCLRFLGPNTHVLAVCQPSVPVLMAVATMAAQDDPCQPASMTLMGGPIDTRVNPTKVNEFAGKHPMAWFEANVVHTVPPTYPGAGRKVYPGFLQLSGFMSMNLDRHVDAHMSLFKHLVQGDGDSADQHRVFYDEYLSVMDLPAEYYLETINAVFKEHLLARGEMRHHGQLVDTGLIRNTALLTVEGEKDDITGQGQTQAAHTLCSGLPDSMRRHHLQVKVGHYGIFNGRRWRQEILPNVTDFIRTHHRADAVLEDDAAGCDVGSRVGIVMRRLRTLLSP